METRRSNLDNIKIVLTSPLYGGNVGSVCRVIRNMGLSHLVIAAPKHTHDDNELRQMASHAIDIYENRDEFPSLREAVADCTKIAVTTARVGLYRNHAKTIHEWAPDLFAAAGSAKVAIVFGPEDSGLSNDDIQLATHLVQIPSAPEYLSINLAQSVMICAYELYLQSGQFVAAKEKSKAALAEDRHRMFDMWREALLGIGFMKEDKADHMMFGLQRILSRSSLTEDDVKILMGIAHQSSWCANELKKLRGEQA